VIVLKFFSFLDFHIQLRKSGGINSTSELILLFIRDIMYFYDRWITNANGAYSIQTKKEFRGKYTDTGVFTLGDLNLAFFVKFLHIVVELLFSSDSLRFFWFFVNRFFLPFQAVFWAFINSSYGQSVPEVELHKMYYDLRMLRLVFNMWLNRVSAPKIAFKKHFLSEFIPLLNYGVPFTDFRAPLFAKMFNFRTQYSGYLPYMRFLNFNMLARWHKDFRNRNPFKTIKFSHTFKWWFRTTTKRIKFAKFLWRALYPRRNPYLYFDVVKSRNVVLSRSFVILNKNKDVFGRRYTDIGGTTTKDLIHRRAIRDRFNAGMLQYFDEEFEDSPFPVNNEFFFLQTAYGSIFLNRQYHRRKLLSAQREAMHAMAALRQSKSISPLQRLRIVFKNKRVLLYFSFSKFLKKVKKTND
jgi:hypothetical protein